MKSNGADKSNWLFRNDSSITSDCPTMTTINGEIQQQMNELYGFQREAVRGLMRGKHIVVAGTGCLAKGTPVKMGDGSYEVVEEVSSGDMVLGYDEYENVFKPSEVECVLRTSHKPKPMIELEYDGEKITTTYDHPFFNGEGFYPLYQLIWGALEASQRVQLKLLCKQYGATFNDTLSRGKHSCCNETCERCKRLPKDSNEWQNGKGSQDSCRELARKSIKLGMCEPYKPKAGRQQGGEFRMVFHKVQHLVLDEDGNNKETFEQEQFKSSDGRTENLSEELLRREYCASETKFGETQGVFEINEDVPTHDIRENTDMGNWKIKIKNAEPYYSICLRTAPHTYCIGRKHCFVTHNSGKGTTAVVWAREKCHETGKDKVLVVTTASKANMKPNDFELDADKWCSPSFRKSLSYFSIISWHKLAAWTKANWAHVGEYVFIFDEVAKASAGVSSGMGKAFLKITARNHDWAGFTATPGDVWIKFYPYFQACGLVTNKTQFMRKYCVMQTFKGYPEIVNYLYTDELKRFWTQVSIAPDTSQMTRELPSETHKTLGFKKPSTYNKTLKTRISPDGEMLDTPGALCAELRRQCFTKDKKQWISDFVENLGDGAVMFYNFIKTGDELEEVIKKALPKGAKIWRIDGKHHDIPTADTIGKYDIVLCQWQSGSEALNLQFLHYWVAVELCYSYSTAVQARGRIKRLGQQRNMRYYYLLTDGTIEQAILKCLKAKSTFSEDVWEAELRERSK